MPGKYWGSHYLEHYQQKFTWYSRMIFDMNDDDKRSDSNNESGNMDGTSYIPNILNLHVLKMKNIMRAFVTFHYCSWSMMNFRDHKEYNPDDIFHFSQWQDANGPLQMLKRHRNPGQRPLIPIMIKKTTEVKDHQHVASRFNNAGQSSLWSISICTKPQAMRRSMNAEQPYTIEVDVSKFQIASKAQPASQRTSCNKTPFLQSGGSQRRSDNPLALTEPRPMPMTPPAPTIGISRDDSRTSNSENTNAGSGPAQ
ncbi:hypothetical protein V8B97DRAFT_1919325 [Scleroderma yunnanense]